MPILLLALFLMARAIVACSSVVAADDAPRLEAVATPCDGGFDDTLLIQTRMSNGQCLPAGVFNVDAPALGSNGRRRDAMLTGSLCGAGAGRTTVRFRGDAHALYWLGVYLPAQASVHDVTLMTCLSNTIEQTHLLDTGVGGDAVWIHDNVFVHPKSADGSKAGDCIHVVGSGTTPNAGMMIDHNVFQACARVGVQVSRGLDDAVIADNTFVGCPEDIGTEGGGSIHRMTIRHNTFTSSMATGYALALEHIDGLTFDHNTVQGRPMLLYFVDDAAIDYSTLQSVVPYSPPLRIGDTAHHIAMSNLTLGSSAVGSSAVVVAAPLSDERQADLADLSITGSELTQAADQSFVLLQGVTGMSLSDSTLTYIGPASYTPVSILAEPSPGVSPATVVQTTGVTETATVHDGF